MSVVAILLVSPEIKLNAKERNRKGTGWPFSQQTTLPGSNSKGFVFSRGTRFFSSVINSKEEEEEEEALQRVLFGGSCSSGVLRLLGFWGDFIFLRDGEEGGEGCLFFLAAARGPHMRASNAEGGCLDMEKQGSQRERALTSVI